MSDNFYNGLVIVLYAVAAILIAVVSKRKLGRGMSEYFLGNRQIGGFIAALTYAATTYSAFMMVGLAGLTYKFGVGALGFELTYLCGLVLVVFFGPRFWLVGRKYHYLTHAQLLADRYDSRAVGVVATAVCLVFLIPYAAIQVMGIGYLLEGVFRGAIPTFAGMAIATVLAIILANIAGLRSVAWTDALQAILMLVASIAAVYFMVSRGFGGVGAFIGRIHAEIPELISGAGLFTFNVYLGICLPWLFFSLSNPQVTQRLFIPKSVTALKQMIAGFLVFGLVYTIFSVLWGFGAKLLVPGLDTPDLATPSLLALAFFPKIVVILVMVGILSAAISTIDSILLSLSSMCSRDIYKGGIYPRASENSELLISKVFIYVLAVVFFVFAFWAAGESGLAFMIAPLAAAASAGLLMAVPTIVGAFFWKRATAAGALSSMIIGACVVLILQVTGWKPMALWPGVWGFVVCIILYCGVSLLTRAPVEKAEEFMGYLARELPKRNFL